MSAGGAAGASSGLGGRAPRMLGAVLAGGASRRFGRDKSAARVGGRSLLDRATATLSKRCAEVVVVSGRRLDTAVAVVPDRRAPCGPLGGIEAALLEAIERGLDGAFVLACDLPLVTEATVAAVIDELAGAPDALASAPRGRDGHGGEPLCAAYRNGCLAAAQDLLDDDRLQAAALLDRVPTALVARPDGELVNVNTPNDRDRAERALRELTG